MPSVYETVAAILLAGMAIAAPQAGKRDKVAISSDGNSKIHVTVTTADITSSFDPQIGQVNPNPPANSKLAKRDIARPQNACPDANAWFAQSYCNRQGGPLQRAFVIECDMPDSSTTGVCDENEICVDGIRHSALTPVMTYCVSMENFVTIAANQHQGVTGDLPDSAADWDQNNVAVEAVLTGKDANSPTLYAEEMEITAYDAWGNPLSPGGVNTCTGATTCASIGLQVLPHGTKEIGVDITLPAGSAGGNLWLPVILPLLSG